MVMQRRAVNLDEGIAMVITDLHGTWHIWKRLRDHFLALHRAGKADHLIIAGDLIHGYGKKTPTPACPFCWM